MADVFTKRQRSAVMAKVRGANTAPERAVRSLLHGLGYRFRLRPRELPGRPDIVLTRHRIAVFVNGCFWHQHLGCEAAARPTSNVRYWNAKLDRNAIRDRMNLALLRKLGWQPVVVWECECKMPIRLERRLKQKLSSGSRRRPRKSKPIGVT